MNGRESAAANNEMSWNHPKVNQYEQTIALKIPGYDHLHDMTERLMAAQLTDSQRAADILVVGAGGGQEMLTLGSRHEAWTFKGIDPSSVMLDIAARRAALAGMEQRVSLEVGTVDMLAEDKRYDAATCLLVLHFVNGIEGKKEVLRDIAQRLHDGAPLFIALINGDTQCDSFTVQMKAWRSHMLANGITLEGWEKFEDSIGRESHLIPVSEIESLLRETGFTGISRYYGAYLINGWFAVKGGGTSWI